jgi:prepilin signal peptidase PulO-like enzyme (type II secretory pathway)
MTPAHLDPLLLVPIAAVGLVFGSFVTALSYRLPRGESIAHGRSKCPACGHTLTALDLVPVFSWMAQGGKCRHCRAKISWRYPAIEAVTVFLFVAAALLAPDMRHMVILMAMTPVIVTLAVIDLEHRRLPNILVIALAALAVLWRLSGDQAIVTGLATAALAGALGLGLDAGFRGLTKKRGLGMGDTKLFALAGLALPVVPYLLFVGLAGVFGVVWGLAWRRRTGDTEFPFAPAILLSYWVCLVAAEPAINRLIALRSG